MRKCKVFVNREYAGLLTELGSENYVFVYDSAYLSKPDAKPVCLALPLSDKAFESDSLFPFFSNLLSEGSNRGFQTKLHHLAPDDDFGLLLKIASYDTIGAVTVEEVK